MEIKKLKFKIQISQRGFVAYYLTILILAVVFGIALFISLQTLGEQKILKNITKSNQAYYAAEAGIEDGLLRVVKKMNWLNSYTFSINNGTTTVEISDIIGGSRTITSEGDILNRIKKIAAVYEISAEKTSFYYGAQVGEGGIIMGDASRIEGNVFSNGNLRAGANTEITGTVKVAKTSNYIDGAKIGGDAYVDICKNSKIGGTLTSITNTNCTATNYVLLSEEMAKKDLPISQNQIEQWKTEAVLGGTTTDYTLTGAQKGSLGPKKIEGNVTVQNQAELSITGTIWLTGNIIVQDEAKVYLDKNTYGSNSGVIVSDGRIILQNKGRALGSGETGSYILLISTAADNQAISIQNKAETDILFAQNGWIVVQDSSRLREVSGYGINLKNSVEIRYEIGLQDTSFTSGPGGSWEVVSWKEIE